MTPLIKTKIGLVKKTKDYLFNEVVKYLTLFIIAMFLKDNAIFFHAFLLLQSTVINIFGCNLCDIIFV